MTIHKPTPFQVSVHDLVHRPGEMREYQLEIPAPEKLGEGLVAVEAGTPISVDLRMESLHDGILVTASIESRAVGVCGRCLIDIDLPVQVEFQDVFAYSFDEAFEYEVQDDHVDLEPVLRDAVVLSLPFQPVCRPDCQGLDPETGQRLAENPDYQPRAQVDPRWSALAEFQASDDTGSSVTDRDTQS